MINQISSSLEDISRGEMIYGTRLNGQFLLAQHVLGEAFFFREPHIHSWWKKIQWGNFIVGGNIL